MLQNVTQTFKNEWPSNLIMEDISQSCQHYVVLAHDQELALSGAEELWLLSANHRRMHSATQHLKTESLGLWAALFAVFLCHSGRCHWKVTGGPIFPTQRFVLSTTASLRTHPTNTGTVCEKSHVWPFKSASRADPLRIHPRDSSHGRQTDPDARHHQTASKHHSATARGMEGMKAGELHVSTDQLWTHKHRPGAKVKANTLCQSGSELL